MKAKMHISNIAFVSRLTDRQYRIVVIASFFCNIAFWFFIRAALIICQATGWVSQFVAPEIRPVSAIRTSLEQTSKFTVGAIPGAICRIFTAAFGPTIFETTKLGSKRAVRLANDRKTNFTFRLFLWTNFAGFETTFWFAEFVTAEI